MKKVFIGLLALNLLLPGASLWLPQSTLAQTQAAPADISELQRLLQLAEQQLQQGQYKQSIATCQQALPIARRLSIKEVEVTILDSIGVSYTALGQPQKALEYYIQVLPLYRAANDLNGEATTMFSIGEVYRTVGQPQKALENYNQALPLLREVKLQNIEARTLFGIGEVYRTVGQPQKALENYTQALSLVREVNERNGEATTLNNIGLVYDNIDQPQKALEYYNQALAISRAVQNRGQEAITLYNIGAVHRKIDQPQKALRYYNQALAISRAVQNRNDEDKALNDIGLVYNDIGQPRKALEYYSQALAISRAAQNRGGEAITLNNIGAVYEKIGQPQKALEYYDQALPILRKIQNRGGEATTLNNIGAVYEKIGQPQKALNYLSQSLSISKEVNDRGGEATTLNNIGAIYYKIGQPQKALEYYDQALPILREVQNRNGEATTLNNAGNIYRDIGQRQKALEYFSQSLSISKEVNDKVGESRTLSNIGAVYGDIGQPQKALEYFSQSLPIRKKVDDRGGEATVLNNIGTIYYKIGQRQKALEYYIQSLPILREVQDRDHEASILGNLADLERSRGNLQVALTHIEFAIKIIETIRTEIVSQEFRTSYFASQQDYYDFYIDVLMQLHKQQPSKGFNALALQASEHARARGLLDLLRESQADIRQGVDPKLIEQEKNLQFQLNALEKRRIELYSKTPTKSQVDGFNKEYDTLLPQYQDVETKIRSNSPRYAALTQPQPLTVAELKQQVLDDNTVLLEYFLGKDHIYLWAVSKSEITSYELPKQSEIEAAIQQFRKVVADSTAQPSAISKGGASLTQMLIAPAAKQIGQKRLLIVSNGALQYLPFAALPALTGSQSLLSEHEIINLPSASTLATLRKELDKRKPAPKTVAVFADPVFSPTDGRVAQRKSRTPASKNPAQGNTSTEPFSIQILRDATQEAGVNFERLPGTRQEAKGILQFLPANMQTQALDFNANKTTVLNANLSQYRIIHFATHGILNTTRPELSAVVLSLVDPKGQPQNGFLRLNDIFNLNLSAELVVLSACQTGLGQNIRGEGLIGLTRGFMYAGTPRVLVSLWNVNDESTAVLMTHFYKAMLEQKLPPATALRAAQLKMQLDPKWRSPYYWAAFTLQGEWK
jgi:CHAT domain-containing protein/Tfp pilus assembly protein PilF